MSRARPPAPVLVPAIPVERRLTEVAFQRLAEVPPEVEWFANLASPATRRAYETALQDFQVMSGCSRSRSSAGTVNLLR